MCNHEWWDPGSFVDLDTLSADRIGELSRGMLHQQVDVRVTELGYHCRDYYVKQWDRFNNYHWGDLAHSTHLRGAGTYDEVHGDRVTVTLATGIPERQVSAVNLDYLDSAAIDFGAWAADSDTLVVPDAGKDLFRLRG